MLGLSNNNRKAVSAVAEEDVGGSRLRPPLITTSGLLAVGVVSIEQARRVVPLDPASCIEPCPLFFFFLLSW